MRTLCCKGVCLRLPSVFSVTRHDHVTSSERFLQSFPYVELSPLVDWPSVAAIGSTFEITLDVHTLTFGVHESAIPLDEYLLGFLQSMTRDKVTERDLRDCKIGPFAATQYGAFSDEFTCIGWATRVGDLHVDLSFQGPGVPTDKIKLDLRMVLDSMHLEATSA